MNSTNKCYCTAFVIFEFYPFDLQTLAHSLSDAWVSLILEYIQTEKPSGNKILDGFSFFRQPVK
jgi:hypothetical protein